MVATEVYAHAPLAMVVAEVKFTHEPSLMDAQTRYQALAGVRDELPILTGKWTWGGALFVPGREAPAEVPAQELLEAMSVDGQTVVTISSEALSISMSGKAYHHYEDTLRPLVGRVVDTVAPSLRQVAIRRVGLRYLDEVRVPEPPSEVAGWSTWINRALLAAADTPIGVAAKQAQSVFSFQLKDEVRVQYSAGTFEGNTVIADEHPFAAGAKLPGPMFVVDVDASWQPSGGFLLFESDVVKSTFDILHVPTSGLFEWSITDQARTLFRGTP